jgi:beta-xylosidase
MFEIAGPVGFAARFAKSIDLKHWEIMPENHCYSMERYTAPHCLRYLDGYYYNFFLEAYSGYEMRVVRSKDFINWELSPYNPILRASDEDKKIYNKGLDGKCYERISLADNTNNSDIDFCEFKGNLIINYSWGNQLGNEFLAEARYKGTLKQFLRALFPD